jgi:nitroreductase
MDAFECIATKLDVREFSRKPVPSDVKKKVLEAARLTGSGNNLQHWRFVLIQDAENLKKLAEASISGKWVESANFAVLILTDPQYNFHLIDAGRVLQDMELAAWNYGVASRVYTRSDKDAMARHFNLPKEMNLTAVLGFGYPAKRIIGRKNRKPLSELAHSERYGQPLTL